MNTLQNNVPDVLGIKFINCDKVVGCTLENQPIEDVIASFSQIWCFIMLVFSDNQVKTITQV